MLSDIELMVGQKDLSEKSAFDLMNRLIEEGTELERTIFLLALHMKGMKAQEMIGFADAVRSHAIVGPIPGVTDIVGTGGDGKKTINVSTAAAILCSGMGIRIAKHGNRAITSPQGSADILSLMNYKFEQTQEELEDYLERTNFVFLLAPHYNASFASFSPARKLLTFKTVMNYMGPITNPTDPSLMVVGTSDPESLDLYADCLKIRNKRGFVVHAVDGMDEISPIANTRIIEMNGNRKQYEISPNEFGIRKLGYEHISSIDPVENRKKMVSGLFGIDEGVAAFIALNAAPALVLNSMASDLGEGYQSARKAIADGIGKEAFQRISERSDLS